MTDGFESHETTVFWPAEASTAFRAPKLDGYRIILEIGDGGMGVVYLAEQMTPRRFVAVKVVKPGMDTRDVIARFENERQALAVLDHPHVARVFDAGATEQGRPYFVMEHVDGVPITEFCDKHRLTTMQRLLLFINVCHAIQHAHQKGIIHRDIKPSNVLVTHHGDKPWPKVIDFGVAKATGERLTKKTLYTEQGRMIGTPEYMSPEQAGAVSMDIDTRVDVYALGVLLYELLVGALPFDSAFLRKQSIGEIQRIIREEEPPKPSSRLKGLGDAATRIAERRAIHPRMLNRQLRGDLDWIILKAIDKERIRRYASVSELAADIDRYLTDRPVSARPPSMRYLFRKTFRRNRGLITACVAVFVALLAGLVTSTALYLNSQWVAYQANISAASSALQLHYSVEAQHNLASVPARFRKNWEWRYLSGQLDQSVGEFVAHPSGVSVVRMTPDGARLISGGFDGSVIVWDALSRQALVTVDAHRSRVYALTISPDGEMFATGSDSGYLRIWLTSTGKMIQEIKPDTQPPRPVESIAFHPDGGSLLVGLRWRGDAPPCLMTIDLRSGETRLIRDVHEHSVNAVAFSPDGENFVSGGEGGKLKWWSTKTIPENAVWEPHELGITSIALSPDGEWCVTGAKDHRVAMTQLKAHGEVREVCRHRDNVADVAFSPDGTLIATASEDRTVQVRDAASGDHGVTLLGHSGVVHSIAFSPDGSQIVSGSSDGMIKFWNVPTRSLGRLRASRGSDVKDTDVYGMDFSTDGTMLATGCRDGTVQIWDVTRRTLLCEPWQTDQEIKALRFSPNDRRLIIITGYFQQDGAVYEWRPPAGWAKAIPSEVTEFDITGEHSPVNRGATISTDTTRFATADETGLVEIWEMRGPMAKQIQSLAGHEVHVQALEFSPDGRLLATKDPVCECKLWNVKSGRQVDSIKTGRFFADIEFSSDGKLLATASSDDCLTIWQIRDVAIVTTLQHSRPVRCAVFSPDAQRIATGCDDGAIHLWDPDKSELLLTLRGHDDEITILRFSPDGNTLVSGSADGEIRFWVAHSPTIIK